jgi:hypothetical protein
MRLPKRLRKKTKKPKPRIPVAPARKRHKSKRDYKRVKKVTDEDQ